MFSMFCNVLKGFAKCSKVLQCFAMFWNVLQCFVRTGIVFCNIHDNLPEVFCFAMICAHLTLRHSRPKRPHSRPQNKLPESIMFVSKMFTFCARELLGHFCFPKYAQIFKLQIFKLQIFKLQIFKLQMFKLQTFKLQTFQTSQTFKLSNFQALEL